MLTIVLYCVLIAILVWVGVLVYRETPAAADRRARRVMRREREANRLR